MLSIHKGLCMSPDINLYGVFVPTFFALLLTSYGLFRVTHRVLAASGVYRHVWHPALFDIALYFALLGVCQGVFEALNR